MGQMELHIDAADLRPVIEHVVAATLERLDAERARFSGRLAYSEAEAAAALGVPRHVLRDCRLRGEIHARKIGRAFRYSRDELVRFLEGTEK